MILILSDDQMKPKNKFLILWVLKDHTSAKVTRMGSETSLTQNLIQYYSANHLQRDDVMDCNNLSVVERVS